MSATHGAPSLTNSPSLRSAAEEDGLRRALEIVREQGALYKEKQGLSPLSFTVGLLNVGFSGFVLGRRPQYYWAGRRVRGNGSLLSLATCDKKSDEAASTCHRVRHQPRVHECAPCARVWQTVKCVACNYVSYAIKKAKHQRLFLLDLCHVISFSYCVISTCSLAAWRFPSLHPILTRFTASPTLFHGCFVIANGPLAWSVPALSNALLLHSAEHTAALFIHISPPMVMWAMRWHSAEHEAAFPGVFGTPLGAAAAAIPYVDLLFPALCFYGGWWVLHLLWLVLHGRHQGRGAGGARTVYHLTMDTIKPFAKLVGFKAEAASRLAPAVGYMCVHAALCVLAILVAPVLWRSFWLHTAFICFLLLSSIYQGSLRYYGMMTSSYEKRLKALLPEVKAKASAPEEGGGEKKRD